MAKLLLRNKETRKLLKVLDRTDMGPLHIAAQNGHLEVVKEFLRFDADLTVRNDSENTPLHIAAGWGKDKYVNVKFVLPPHCYQSRI